MSKRTRDNGFTQEELTRDIDHLLADAGTARDTGTVRIEDQSGSRDVLTELLRHGARRMLATALQVEVDDYIQQYADLRDDDGYRMVVRNGYKPTRTIQSGLGDIEVTQPRVNDRRTDDEGNRIVFTSKILPPFLRKTRAVEELIPWLYLKGISTGDFSEALAALLGPDAPGPRRSCDSKRSGRMSSSNGMHDRCLTSGTCISGWTRSTSQSALKRTVSASWW